MKKYLFLVLFLSVPNNFLFAQVQSASACSDPEYNIIDFWLGSWKATWDGGEGTNTITKSHGGCVVNEDFRSPDLLGMSISTYDRVSDQWRQTWMDNQGSYFSFYGIKDNKNYIFQTFPDPKDTRVLKRMVFTDIKKGSFTWLWQNTTDSGKNWQDAWKIKYTRLK